MSLILTGESSTVYIAENAKVSRLWRIEELNLKE